MNLLLPDIIKIVHIKRNSSISYELFVINKLYDKTPITPLSLKEDEFEQSIVSKILYINKRYNKIYKYLNKMCFTNAYSISPQYILSTKTKNFFLLVQIYLGKVMYLKLNKEF